MLFSKEKVTKEVSVEGMSCMHCAAKVEKALGAIKGVSDVKVDLNAKKATMKLKHDIDDATIKNAVDELGFKVMDIK